MLGINGRGSTLGRRGRSGGTAARFCKRRRHRACVGKVQKLRFLFSWSYSASTFTHCELIQLRKLGRCTNRMPVLLAPGAFIAADLTAPLDINLKS